MSTATTTKGAAYFAGLKEKAQQPLSQRPLTQFLATFLSDKQAEGTSIGYRRELERIVTSFIRFLEEGLERPPLLADLTIDGVRAFILSEQERPRWVDHPMMRPDGKLLSAQMVQNETRMLKVFGSYLEAEEFTKDDRGEPVNVLRRLKLPRVEKKEIQPLTVDEEAKLIKACDDRTHPGCRRQALVLLYLDTGARLSELAGLRMDNLYLEEGYLRISWETAKGKKERSVPFGHKAGRALRRYLTFYREAATVEAQEYVFLDMDGYPITGEAIKQVVKRLAKRTGLTRLHTHLLRHTFGTRAAESNINTLYLQTLMGHSSSKVTELYTHLAGSESLKRDRTLSHVDRLVSVKVRREQRTKTSRRNR